MSDKLTLGMAGAFRINPVESSEQKLRRVAL
jgi:hypothetical protein